MTTSSYLTSSDPPVLSRLSPGQATAGVAVTLHGANLDDGLQTTVIQYEYDPLYRLTAAAYNGDLSAEYSYIYDAAGNMTAYTETVGMTTTVVGRTFNAANQLVTSSDTELGTTSFYYDANGNLTMIIRPGDSQERLYYHYNQRNLLTLTEEQQGQGPALPVAEFVYDGDSNRLQQTDHTGTTPLTTTYTNDIVGLSQVLVSDNGTTQTTNLFGLDLISQDDGTETRFMLADGLGSVRVEMVNNAVETTTTYEPYGKVLAQTGAAGTVYGFTGEQSDALTSLVYLRARYYNPALHMFMGKDPWRGSIWRPTTLNGYDYVGGNPVNKTDPSGLCEQWLPDENCWLLVEQLWTGGAGSLAELGAMTEAQLAGIKIVNGSANVYWPPDEIESIKDLLPTIKYSSQLHNPSNSNLDDASFAALMITVLHWEGRLPGNAKPNTLNNWLHDTGSDLATWAGLWNGSTGIANIRPDVALQLHQEGYIIEGSGYSEETEGLLRNNCRINPLQFLAIELQESSVSIEFLAANLERGVYRVRAAGLEPSAFNLAAWLNTGAYTPEGFADPDIGPKAISYGNTIIGTMPEAFTILGQRGIYRAYNADEHAFVDIRNR